VKHLVLRWSAFDNRWEPTTMFDHPEQAWAYAAHRIGKHAVFAVLDVAVPSYCRTMGCGTETTGRATCPAHTPN